MVATQKKSLSRLVIGAKHANRSNGAVRGISVIEARSGFMGSQNVSQPGGSNLIRVPQQCVGVACALRIGVFGSGLLKIPDSGAQGESPRAFSRG